jgi:hypothetical protein
VRHARSTDHETPWCSGLASGERIELPKEAAKVLAVEPRRGERASSVVCFSPPENFPHVVTDGFGWRSGHRPSGEPDLSEHRLGGVDAVEQAYRIASGVSDPSNVSG